MELSRCAILQLDESLKALFDSFISYFFLEASCLSDCEELIVPSSGSVVEKAFHLKPRGSSH